MSDLRVPADLDAERELVGAVLARRDAHEQALPSSTSATSTIRAWAGLFEAAPAAWAVPPPPEPAPDDAAGWARWSPARDRAEVVAALAGVSVAEVEHLRDRSSWQIAAPAGRIVAARRARHLMAAIGAAYNALGQGTPAADVLPLLREGMAA